jgi:hypothetical protein
MGLRISVSLTWLLSRNGFNAQGDIVARFDRTLTLDGLEDQFLFDVAFVMKWVQLREMLLVLALTGKCGVGLFCVRG